MVKNLKLGRGIQPAPPNCENVFGAVQWHVLVVKSQAAVVNDTQLNDELHLANEHGEFG